MEKYKIDKFLFKLEDARDTDFSKLDINQIEVHSSGSLVFHYLE